MHTAEEMKALLLKLCQDVKVPVTALALATTMTACYAGPPVHSDNPYAPMDESGAAADVSKAAGQADSLKAAEDLTNKADPAAAETKAEEAKDLVTP